MLRASDGTDLSNVATLSLSINIPVVIVVPPGTVLVESLVNPTSIYPEEFGYTSDYGSEQNVVILESVPSVGTLRLAGNVVSVGDQVDYWSLEYGSFAYHPDLAAGEDYSTTFTFSLSDGNVSQAHRDDHVASSNPLPARFRPAASMS